MYLFLLIGSSGLLINCGSDEPDLCETVVCENGTCTEDGSCICDDGWEGATCAEFDFSGEWWMTQYTLIDCPRFFATDIRGDGSTRQLCGKADDFDVCYETNINFAKDKTFNRYDALFLHNDDGTVETIFETLEEGTWNSEDNNTKLRTRTNGVTGSRLFTVSADRKSMSRLQNETDGGVDCNIEVSFLISN